MAESGCQPSWFGSLTEFAWTPVSYTVKHCLIDSSCKWCFIVYNCAWGASQTFLGLYDSGKTSLNQFSLGRWGTVTKQLGFTACGSRRWVGSNWESLPPGSSRPLRCSCSPNYSILRKLTALRREERPHTCAFSQFQGCRPLTINEFSLKGRVNFP